MTEVPEKEWDVTFAIVSTGTKLEFWESLWTHTVPRIRDQAERGVCHQTRLNHFRDTMELHDGVTEGKQV